MKRTRALSQQAVRRYDMLDLSEDELSTDDLLMEIEEKTNKRRSNRRWFMNIFAPLVCLRGL
jgi:hypothetical protein